MAVLLIRHGQTVFNRSGVMQGRNDSPLTAEGRQAMSALAQLLGREPRPARFYCSPLGRAVTSAGLIARALSLQVSEEEMLSEIDFGQASGLSLSAFEQEQPEAARLRAADRWNTPWPGGESYRDAHSRALSLVTRLGICRSEEDVWILGHQSMNRMLLAALLGVSGEVAMDVPQKNSQVIRVQEDTAELFGLEEADAAAILL